MMPPTVVLVAGLAFGDEGKGATVDYLTRRLKASTVVRYNGGAQAAHNVVTDDGRHHTFQQFGAGTFAGARTFLSKHMLVNPINLLAEARALSEKGVTDPLKLMAVDHRARIVTPFHIAANRLREMSRGSERHGSCGEGIGETVSDWLAYGSEMIDADDLLDEKKLRAKLHYVRSVKREQLRTIVDRFMSNPAPMDPLITQELRMLLDNHIVEMCVARYKKLQPMIVDGDEHLGQLMEYDAPIVFEGAQGVLLDEWYGFHPYTTWSTTTFANADEMLKPFGVKGRRVGVLRSYATRHGAGPFVTELSKNPDWAAEAHNGNGAWQGAWRVGQFDLNTLAYAVAVCGGVDEIALTHLDRLSGPLWATYNVCDGYSEQGTKWYLPTSVQEHDLAQQEQLTQRMLRSIPCYMSLQARELENAIECVSGGHITIRSYGPRASDKR